MTKVCLITGGSSGIGLHTALELKNAGFRVYEMSRREQGVDGIVHLRGDVTDETQVAQAVDTVLAREGHIDLLINNAGFGVSGAIEFTPAEEAKHQFDVNFFGMVNMNRAILPVMRRQGYGRIVNISSVAAPIPIPFQAYYSASKAAVSSYTMALANEVKPFGVQVCAVQPGDVRTGFSSAREKVHRGDDVYNGRISRSVGQMEQDEKNGMPPEFAAKFIARAATRKRIKPLSTIGVTYRFFCLLAKLLPARWLNFIVGLIYAR